MKRSIRKTVDPYPCMARGETPFEEKRIKCDFEAVFKQIANFGMSSLKDTYEYCYRAAFVAGKAAGKRESLGSPPTETLNTSPLNASVRETAGAQKEHRDGTITSD
jgi:hypothetical protein